jgi:hypothetical protein
LRVPPGDSNVRARTMISRAQFGPGYNDKPVQWYRPVDGYFGPQNALLTMLVLTGVDGVTKPVLPTRH